MIGVSDLFIFNFGKDYNFSGPGWLTFMALLEAPGISAWGFLVFAFPGGSIFPSSIRGGSCRLGVGLAGMESPVCWVHSVSRARACLRAFACLGSSAKLLS